MKQVIQYICLKCGLKYQLSQGVEIVNSFGWKKADKIRCKPCKECSEELTDTVRQ